MAWWTLVIALLIGAAIALTITYAPSSINSQQHQLELLDLALSDDSQEQLQAITQISDQWQQLNDQQRCEIAALLLQANDPFVRNQALSTLLAQHGPDTTTLPPLHWVADDPELARRLILASHWTNTQLQWPTQQPIPIQLHELIDPETGQTNPPAFPLTPPIFPPITTTSTTPSILTALHAEQVNTPQQNRALSKEWIVDLNDKNKQSGALLAALTNDNLEHLQAAFNREDNPRVRAIQYLALAIAGVDVDTTPQLPPADELAWRSMHQQPDGSLDLNMLASGLALGEPSFLETLIKTKPSSPTDFSQRMQLLQRFAPPLATRMGPPPIGNDVAITHYQDSLLALHELSSKQLTFDQKTHRFKLIAPQSHLQDDPSERHQPSYDCLNNDER